MNTFSLDTQSHAVLSRVGEGAGGIATHWLNEPAGFTDTAKTRRLLKRLERAGLVAGQAASRSGLVFWWAITPEGRQALAAACLRCDGSGTVAVDGDPNRSSTACPACDPEHQPNVLLDQVNCTGSSDPSTTDRQNKMEREHRLPPRAPAAFTLDTAGAVLMPVPDADIPGRSAVTSVPIVWRDLSPFTQGFVEGLFASIADVKTPWGAGYDVVRALRFSDLAPETLAAILKDCAAWLAQYSAIDRNAESGARFWAYRQAQDVLRLRFPPLTVSLGDDGKVYLTTGAA